VLITEFDPWKNELCTCPVKYSLNPYTGCSHGCLYCYISSYIRDPFRSRPKKDLSKRIELELKRLGHEITFISLSNSSDPYPPQEREMRITRDVLEVLGRHGIRFQIVTKSDIVARDTDIIGKNSVSMTITKMKNSRAIEPGAPDTEKRLKALRELSQSGIRCSLRLDPVMPGMNDSEENIYGIIHEASDSIEHVTSSTLKPRADALVRLERSFPRIEWKKEYSERVGGSRYLPERTRLDLMTRVRDICTEHGLTFSCCREGFDMNAGNCDGSHLIGDKNDRERTECCAA
jgi:DNA repair photolyase